MKLIYSNTPAIPVCSKSYEHIDWDTLMAQEVDGVYCEQNSRFMALLYKGKWYFLQNYVGGRVTQTLRMTSYTDLYFYRSHVLHDALSRIPYEVQDVNNNDQWIRTGKPLTLKQRIIYALPKWIRRWIPGINT